MLRFQGLVYEPFAFQHSGVGAQYGLFNMDFG
jgi:hypothetical protein